MKDKVLVKWKKFIKAADSTEAVTSADDCIHGLAGRVRELRKREKEQHKAYCKRLAFYVDQVNDMAEEHRTQAQPKLAELTQLIASQDKRQERLQEELGLLTAQQESIVDAWQWTMWVDEETIIVNKEWHEELERAIHATRKG